MRSVPMPKCVQQRAALGRRAVGGDARARRPSARRAARRAPPRARRRASANASYGVERRRRPSPPPRRAASRHRVRRLAHVPGGGEDPQRAAVDRDALDVDDDEPVAREQRVERGEREVAEVLVVDRVELAAVDHVLDVRRLDHRDAVVGEQRSRCPATKPFRSGTCASTLFAWSTSARACRLAASCVGELRRRRIRRSSGCPAPRRPRRCCAAGSMPSTGTPRAA